MEEDLVKTHSIVAMVVGLAFTAALLVGCRGGSAGNAGTAGLAPADADAIRKADAAYVQAANAKDWTALSNIYAEDAQVLPPDVALVEGREAIRGFFSAFPPMSDFTIVQSEIDGRGDLAYARGTFSMNMGGTPGGHVTGKFIEVWRKQPDGSWKISRDIWNLDPAGTGQAAAEKK